MEKEIGRLREILRNSNYTVALCGSGMTEESGFIGIKSRNVLMKSSVFMERLRKKFSPAPTTIPARCSSLNFTMKKYWIKYRNRALPAI